MTFEQYEAQFRSDSPKEFREKVNQAVSETIENLKKQNEKTDQMLNKRNEYEKLWKQEKKKCGIFARIFKKEEAAKAQKKAMEYQEKYNLYSKAFLKEYELSELLTKEAKELAEYVKFTGL